jgi:hypothetical protein
MQKHLSVKTQRAGIVHINCQTGQMFWEEGSLDPVVQQYAKKYLVQEGFVEQALGILDPQPQQGRDLVLDDNLELKGWILPPKGVLALFLVGLVFLPFALDPYLFRMELIVGILDRRALGLGAIFFMFCVRRFWFHETGSDPTRPPVVSPEDPAVVCLGYFWMIPLAATSPMRIANQNFSALEPHSFEAIVI